MPQRELAERMLIEAPTLVGVLDRMERDGWIRRVTDHRDRRRKLIRVTQQVEPVWAKMVDCALALRAEATQGIDQETLDVVRKTLTTMRRNLSGEAVVDQLARQSLNDGD